jgi:hypothetical protein
MPPVEVNTSLIEAAGLLRPESCRYERADLRARALLCAVRISYICIGRRESNAEPPA